MSYFGIDLGTSNCLAARVDEGLFPGEIELNLLDVGNGDDSFPSVVSFSTEKRYVVGDEAVRRLTEYPDSTIELVKIRLGQTDEITVNINGSRISKTPQEVTSLLLRHIKDTCPDIIEKPVITVPAFFDQSQKNATMQAAKLVDIEPDQLIEEPTAALIYQIYRNYERDGDAYLSACDNRNYLVFDFGGGTLDLSLINLRCDDGEVVSKTLSIGGDPKLGGNLIDFIFADYIIGILKHNYGEKVTELADAFDAYFNSYLNENRLQFPNWVSKETKNLIFIIKREAERCKIVLSSENSVKFVLTQDFAPITITRQQFEEYVLDDNPFNICFRYSIEDALYSMNYYNTKINEVLLVGGSSQIPYIKDVITDVLTSHGVTHNAITYSEDSLHAVALGAAIQSALRNGLAVKPFRQSKFLSVVPRDILIDCGGPNTEVFIEAGTEYPFTKPKEHHLVIPHALALSVQLHLSERVKERGGRVKDKSISDYTFRLPLYYTGDEIVVNMNIDEAGLYSVSAKHLQTEEIVEFESAKAFSLTDAEMKSKVVDISSLTEI